MFVLNEAPNMALSALSSVKTKRGCGTFFSLLCCLPTLGASIGVYDIEPGNGDYEGCCFPRSLTLKSKAGLRVLIETLESIKVVQNDLEPKNIHTAVVPSSMIKGKNNIDERKAQEANMIIWQVKQTINILKQAMDQGLINGGYQNAIRETFIKISTRAEQEEKYLKILNKEDIPQGCNLNLADYKITR